MLRSLHLKGVGPAPELSLEFAPRLNLLTGDNGLGKSFVLDIAWWALTDTWAGHHARPREEDLTAPTIGYEPEPGGIQALSSYDFATERWKRPGMHKFSGSSIVIYAKVDGGFSIWDSARNSQAWGEFIWGDPLTARSLGVCHFSPDALWNGLSEDSRVLCEGLIRDWVSWQRQGAEPFKQLQEILKALSPEGEDLRPAEPARVSLADVRDHPTLEMPYGTIPLILASAGMKRVVSLAYLLVWTWQEHLQASKLRRQPPADRIVFLVDEIEAHLHPKWQRLILPALLKAAEILRQDAKVQVLVTTHAPLVLASAEPLFDEDQDALFTFDLEAGKVEVARKDWRRRGDACSWLTSDVFDLGEARSLPAETAIQRAKEAMKQPGLSLEERREIHHQLRDVLKDTDPFWTRWLAQAKAAGIEP
jgi:putative AbiEii toxin of type IV toxin-antitoxin system